MFVSEAGERAPELEAGAWNVRTEMYIVLARKYICDVRCGIFKTIDISYMRKPIFKHSQGHAFSLEATHATISGRRGTARAVVLLVFVLVLLLG